MSETDLYLPVKRFLEAQGYVVKSEVRDCDVVACRGDEPPLIVELKMRFSLQHLLQGVDRQSLSDAVYLAFQPPQRGQRSDIIKLCRRLGLGVMIVTGNLVEAVADPLPYRPAKNARRKGLLLKEFAQRVGDPNIGGSTRRPRMTAYRQDALRLVAELARSGPSKTSALRQIATAKNAVTMLQTNVYGWFQRESRAVYALSPKGIAAREEYAAAIQALDG